MIYLFISLFTIDIMLLVSHFKEIIYEKMKQ
jgi:hypothetical protein